MNDYEKKLEAKRERLEDRADKKRAEGNARLATAHRIHDGIPMGQPILVGHHSERRHRRDLERADTNIRKGLEAREYADELAHRAEGLGTHGISSDDPEAISKLRIELEQLKANREWETSINKQLRALAKGFKKEFRREPTQTDHVDMIEAIDPPSNLKAQLLRHARAFAWLPKFGNNTQASIKRIEARIAELEKRDAAPERVIVGDGFRIVDNKLANRTQVIFNAIPSPELRAKLKFEGFRWSPAEGAWQRHLSNGAWYHATRILGVQAVEPVLVVEGCGCLCGSTCDVSHDPATCPCEQCRTGEPKRRAGGTE